MTAPTMLDKVRACAVMLGLEELWEYKGNLYSGDIDGLVRDTQEWQRRIEKIRGTLQLLVDDDQIARAEEDDNKFKAERDRWKKLESEAAQYVETVIVSRCGFTGQPPYVGWKGLGLALTEYLDKVEAERDTLKAEAAKLGIEWNAEVDKWAETKTWLEAELQEARGMVELLRDAMKPFHDIAKDSAGHIPVERLSLSDWHNVWKALSATAESSAAFIAQVHAEALPPGFVALPVRDYILCNTGEDVAVANDRKSLEQALRLLEEKQAADEDEEWEIVASIDHETLRQLAAEKRNQGREKK